MSNSSKRGLAAPVDPIAGRRSIPLSDPQAFINGEIHNWYNFVLGFSDKLVSAMMDRLAVDEDQIVLDAFCGTGTTLVESMKRGIASVGIDASPFSCFVSRVKTNRGLSADTLLRALVDVGIEYDKASSSLNGYHTAAYKYLQESGMIARGWISAVPLRHALALKEAIYRASPNAACRDALLLALVAHLSTKIGNMKYGPEIYRFRHRRSVDVWQIFQKNALQMVKDLCIAENAAGLAAARVLRGDARNCSSILARNGYKKVHVAITSPPYPAEHDYTRNTRLELAFLDFVTSNDCVRSIKRAMVRSHTKGVYKTDRDALLVADNRDINTLAEKVARRCKDKEYGFARLYPTVIRSYFGGMKRHLESVSSVLMKQGRYALVVGDQASYLGTHVPTADLLGQIAEEVGFKVEDQIVWRTRKPSTKKKLMKEHALILKKVA
jgi:DNA modification methylase